MGSAISLYPGGEFPSGKCLDIMRQGSANLENATLKVVSKGVDVHCLESSDRVMQCQISIYPLHAC